MDPESKVLLQRIVGLAIAFAVLLWVLGSLGVEGTW
jgi:hypothetical protein